MEGGQDHGDVVGGAGGLGAAGHAEGGHDAPQLQPGAGAENAGAGQGMQGQGQRMQGQCRRGRMSVMWVRQRGMLARGISWAFRNRATMPRGGRRGGAWEAQAGGR